MSEWVENGGNPVDWPRSFAIVFVSDREPSELQHLWESTIRPVGVTDTVDFAELQANGEMTRTYAQLEQYING